MLDFWKRPYTLRHYGEQKIRKGYASRTYVDSTVMLDIQVVLSDGGPTESGKRETKKIRAFGDDEIVTASVDGKTQGDRIFFEGEWYECTSSAKWSHTPLAHYESTFVRVSEAVSKEDKQVP